MKKRVFKRTLWDKNEITCEGLKCFINLYNRKVDVVARAIIDKKDKGRVQQHKWRLSSNNYVKSSDGIYLHRHLTKAQKGRVVDHINHNRLDNRRKNMRVCTHVQNLMNQKGVKGYCWDKQTNSWLAYIGLNGKDLHLGRFKKEQDAKKARKEAEKKYFKEYAYNC